MHIVDSCRGPYGSLSSNRKKLLECLLAAPDQRLWERARGLIIRAVPIITLQMAVQSVRQDHDDSGVPDPFTLYRALRAAIERPYSHERFSNPNANRT